MRGLTAEPMWKLQSIGYLVETNEAEPVIYARLPVGLIKELSRDTFNWPEVERLYKPVEMQPLMDVSRRTVMADVAHFRNIEGFGVRVGMAEARNFPAGVQSGRVAAGFTGEAANNPFLFGTTVDTTNLGAGAGAHATEVAGVIRMLDIDDEVFRGISPWVNLWAGGGTSYAHLETAINNAIRNGGGRSSVVNMSYGGQTQGTPGAHSRFADAIVFDHLRTLVVAAGNSGNDAVAANRRVNMPGDAYNVITVGNMDDDNTVRWNDDSIRPSSSFGLATARMKPELVAPGTGIRTTSIAAPWNNSVVTGTSFAAPHVTGTAALMIEAEPYVAAWPELIKAILMCNALHDVTDAPGARAATGCIIANQSVAHAKDTNANMGWATGTVGADCNPTSGGDGVFNLNAGQRLRFVLCWLQNPNWGPTDANGYAARPSADYDLHLYRVADNRLVASSASFLNNFEIIDYTIPANQGGQYRMEIRMFRCGDAAIANNNAARSPGRRVIAYRIDPKKFAYVDVTTSSRNVYKLGQATLTATLRNIENNNPLNNKPIRFVLKGYRPEHPANTNPTVIGTVNTNAQGIATLNWNIPANLTLARYRLVAEFPGDNNFEYTSGATPVFVYPARTKINAQNQAGNAGQMVQLRGTLICTENNARLQGKRIRFGIEGVNVGEALTDANGVATFNYTIPANFPAGGRRLDMFSDPDEVYEGGYGRATLAVNRRLVQGRIQLESMTAPLAGLPLRLVVKQGGSSETIDTAIENNSGDYTALTSLSGTNATVSAKINGGSWLRERQTVSNLTGVVTVDFLLMNGDVNRDNRIDDADLLGVLFDFGRTGSNLNSDLNRDGRVDDADLLIVLFNFGATGDPQ